MLLEPQNLKNMSVLHTYQHLCNTTNGTRKEVLERPRCARAVVRFLDRLRHIVPSRAIPVSTLLYDSTVRLAF